MKVETKVKVVEVVESVNIHLTLDEAQGLFDVLGPAPCGRDEIGWRVYEELKKVLRLAGHKA